MANEPSEADIHAFYAAAHHDLWWAKGHLWTTTNWLLALLGVIVGIAALLYPNAMTLQNTWLLVALGALLSTAASGYLARLHYDIVRARQDAKSLRSQRPSLAALYDALPKHREPSSDAYRGILFLSALMVLIALGLGLTVFVLTRWLCLAFIIGTAELLLAFLFLFFGVKYGAA